MDSRGVLMLVILRFILGVATSEDLDSVDFTTLPPTTTTTISSPALTTTPYDQVHPDPQPTAIPGIWTLEGGEWNVPRPPPPAIPGMWTREESRLNYPTPRTLEGGGRNVLRPVLPAIPGIWKREKSTPPTTSSSFPTTLVPGTWSREPSQPRNETINGSGDVTNSSAAQDKSKVMIETLCGFPPYNDMDKCFKQKYFTDPLSQCEYQGGAAAFGTIIGVMGILIVVANCLLPIVVWKLPDMRTQQNYIKVSLAFADILLGILLFADVLPNMMRVRKLSEYQATLFIKEDTNSPGAIITAALWILSTQASILHLMFLTLERFLAITWPLWHMSRRTSTIGITLGIVWAVSLFCSFLPAALHEDFQYQLQPSLLAHWIGLKERPLGPDGSRQFGIQGPMYSLTLLLPYLIMLAFCILTGIVSYRKLKSSSRHFGSEQGNRSIRQEVSVFVTISAMIVAFSVTLLPFAIISFLFMSDVFNCFNYTIPYSLSFYVGLLNGLANPIVYTIREAKFRKTIRSLAVHRGHVELGKQPILALEELRNTHETA